MDFPVGSAITTRSNSGAFTVRIGVPGMLGYRPRAAHTYQLDIAPRSSLPGSPSGSGPNSAAHPVDRALGLPRLTDVVVQPGHPEARLVAGPQIGLVGAHVELLGEAVEPVGHRLAAAEGGHQAGDVMRHPPDVLLGVALVVSVLAEASTGASTNPGPSGKKPHRAARRDVAGGGIEQVLPVLGPVLEFGGGRGVAERLGESGDGEVVDGPLQRDRGAGDPATVANSAVCGA